MAKRKSEFDEDDDNGDERAVFVDTSLNTHFVLLVSHLDTLSLLKQKILLEHLKCFPDFGEIKINALKVKKKGCYYHMSDSMLVKTAFHGVAKNWFLFADVSSEIAYAQTQMNVHPIIPAKPTKTKVTLVGSSKLFKSDYCNKDDHYGTYKIENKSNPEMLKIEGNSLENSLKLGYSGGTTRSKKKRRCKGQHQNTRDDNAANTHLYTDYVRDMAHVVPLQNSALQQQGINCNAGHQTLYIECPSGDGDVQSSGLLGRHNTEDADDHGKKLPSSSKQMLDIEIQKDFHLNSKGKEPPSTESQLKSVGNDTKWKNSVDDEALPSSPTSEKKSKARSVISDPNRATYEPETIVNKSDGENMQSSRLVGLNCLSSKVPKTKKVSGKRKMQEIQADNEFAYSEINEKQNLKDIELHAHSAFSIATDATTKVESVQGSLGDGGNKLVKEVQGARQLEGTGTSLAELVNNGKEPDIVGLACGSRAKKTKKAKKEDIDGVNRSHPITSSKGPDILNAVAPLENENTINDCEQDNLKVTEAGKEVQWNYDPKLLSQQEPLTLVEKEIEEDIAPLEPENTAKRKRTKKAKNSVTEKQELYSTDNHQDAGNRTSSNGYAEDHNRHGPTDEGDKGKTTNEIVVLGSTANKKKVKKGKNSVAEKPDLSSKDNIKDMASHKELNVIPHPEVKKLDKKQQEEKLDLPSSVDTSASGHNMITSKKSKGSERTEDVTQLQDDDDRKTEHVRKIGNDSLQLKPPQVNKPEENAEIRSDKPKKRTQKKQTVVEDPPVSPVEKQLDEETTKMAMPKPADSDLLKNRDINDSNHQKEASLGESLHEEFNDFPAVSEVKKLNKQEASKQGAKELDRPSSVDTLSNGPNLIKSKKMKGSERTSEEGAELCKSISEQKHMPKPSVKPPRNSKQGIETQVLHGNSLHFVAKVATLLNQNKGGGKSYGTSSVRSDSSVRRTYRWEKAKELQKKPDDDYVGSRRSSLKNMGEVNASAQRNDLLVTSGAIFEDGSSASSDGEDKMDGSVLSTRTPSENLSSDNSEGESEGIMVTSAHDSSEDGGKNTTNSNIGSKKLTLESILRSSSKYRKAKLLATQSQVEDGESLQNQ